MLRHKLQARGVTQGVITLLTEEAELTEPEDNRFHGHSAVVQCLGWQCCTADFQLFSMSDKIALIMSSHDAAPAQVDTVHCQAAQLMADLEAEDLQH